MPSGVYPRTEYHRKITSEGIKNFIKNNPEKNGCFKKGSSPWNKGKKIGNYSEERRKGLSLSHTGLKYPNRKKATEETKNIIRKVSTEQWKNPEYIKKQIKARKVSQNKTEKKLENILQNILGNKYLFVGDGKFILAGKCPDFLNKDDNKIIELYGNYWHRNDNPSDRIELFRKEGYETLVIWENELKDIKFLEEKIVNFDKLKEVQRL